MRSLMIVALLSALFLIPSLLSRPRVYAVESRGMASRKTSTGVGFVMPDRRAIVYRPTLRTRLSAIVVAVVALFQSIFTPPPIGRGECYGVMFPHLEVRPLIDPRALPFLKGTQGYRPATAIAFHHDRQSRRSFERAMDNAKRRLERWEASAEAVLLGSFPAYAASADKPFNLVGALPPGQEVRELKIVFEFTLKVNAGTGQVQAPDYNIIAVALLNKLRATLYGIGDAYNLTAVESRTISVVADSRDPFQLDPASRIGAALSTTAFATKLTLKVPFCDRSLEVPEIFSPTSDQINLPGSKIDLDTNGTALTTVALTSGAGTVAVSDVKLYAVLNQIPALHAGPPQVWRNKAIAQNIDTEFGAGCDLFVGSEEASTAAGAGARVSQYTVFRDGRQQPRNVDPVTLAQDYNAHNFTMDALAPIDITVGTIPRSGVATATQPVPDGSIGTQAGAAVVPLIFNDGMIRAGAWQWPTWLASRQVQQNLVAGQLPSITLLYWQVRPIWECAGQIISLAAANGVKISGVDDLAVRGGNDGEVYKQFKGRFMRMRVAPKAVNAA